MTVQQLHRTLGALIEAGAGRYTVLQMRDPEGNGTPQLANHVELGVWKPKHDKFIPEDELKTPTKMNAIVIWPR